MHPRMIIVSTKESPVQRVARQLRLLMERHDATPQEVMKRTNVSDVTVRRILKAEAKTEPEPQTLRKIAVAFGESYEEMFPESEAEIIEVDGRKIALKSLDGRPLPKDFLDRIKHLSVDHAVDVHTAKQSLKKKR